MRMDNQYYFNSYQSYYWSLKYTHEVERQNHTNIPKV
jgi:hypothetical protein